MSYWVECTQFEYNVCLENANFMGHITHQRNQSINTFVQSYCYTLTLITRKKIIISYLRIEWSFISQKMLCARFGWNCLCGSGEDFLILPRFFHDFDIISPELCVALHLNKLESSPLKGRGPGINSSQSKNVGKIQLSMQLSSFLKIYMVLMIIINSDFWHVSS